MKVTKKELTVLNVIADNMKLYKDEGIFSDIIFHDLVAETGFAAETVKGLIGSLEQKDLIYPDEVNGYYNVYYLNGDALKLIK